MTREEALQILDTIPTIGEQVDALEMAIQALSQEPMRDATPEEQKSVNDYIRSISKPTGVNFWALEQEPCDDAISREAVIDAIERVRNNHAYDEIEEIQKLPSVTQKSGKWIELPKALNPNENPCKCSECGHILSFMNCYPKSNFCPNCGAKMVEPQERSEK